MRAFLCRQGQELRQTWRSGLSGDVMQVSAAFFVLVLVFYAACMALPTLREGLVGQLLKILGIWAPSRRTAPSPPHCSLSATSTPAPS